MPDFKRYPNEGFPYFVTTNVRDGQSIFAEHSYCQIVMDCIRFLRTRSGHQVHAYVLMPDHMHLVITPREDSNVSQVMHSLKLYTSRQIGALLGVKGGIWQVRFYERALRTRKDVEGALVYIHDNPVKAGLAEKPEIYDWSSYRACVLGESTPIELDTIFW